MRFFTPVPLYLSLFAHVSASESATSNDSSALCVESCENSLRSVRYTDVDPTASPLRQACQSRLALSSKYLCLGLNCGAETRDSTLRSFNTTCDDSFGGPIPAFKTDYTDEEVAALKKIEKGDSFDLGNPLDEVVVPSPELFNAWFNTLVHIPVFEVCLLLSI